MCRNFLADGCAFGDKCGFAHSPAELGTPVPFNVARRKEYQRDSPTADTVWCRLCGVFGHIAIALAADPMALLTFDQNWPEGSPSALTLHDYGGVLGWWALAG